MDVRSCGQAEAAVVLGQQDGCHLHARVDLHNGNSRHNCSDAEGLSKCQLLLLQQQL